MVAINKILLPECAGERCGGETGTCTDSRVHRRNAVNRVSDGAAIAAYVYDAMNRRVRKTVTNGGLAGNIPNGTTDSCWFGWQTMEERNPYGGSGSTDTPTKEYIWGTYIDECIQIHLLVPAGPQQLPLRHYYLLQDTLHRAVALTNSGGEIQEAYDTDAYGNTIIFTGPGADNTWFTDDDTQSSYGANNIIYCGYRCDAETENYYVRNRYYSPTLGRWLTRDPIGYQGGINLYGYVNSSPVGKNDSTGLAAEMRVTGNPQVDAKTYLDSIRDHEADAAEDFIKEAAKKYAEDGDSASFAKALRSLATGDKGISEALGEAADAVVEKGLDAASKDLGAALQAEVGVLKGLSSGPCITMLIQLYKALQEAKKGNPGLCHTLSMSNNAFSNCQQAIYNTGSPGGVWVGTFARKAQDAGNRLAAKECKKGKKIG